MKKSSLYLNRRILIAILIGAALGALTLFPHATTAADGVTIPISDYAFDSGSVTIQVGTTVTWVNRDADGHTTTSDTGIWDSGEMAQDGTYSFTFKDTGTFTYACTNHPSMVGTIIVTPAE